VSFRSRLVLAYLALLALTLAAFGVGVYAYVDTRLHRDLVSAFEAQAKQYARLVGGPSGYANVWRIKQNLEDEPRRLPSLYYTVDARHLPEETKDFKNVSVNSPGLTDDALPTVPADGKAHLVKAKSNGLGRPLATDAPTLKVNPGDTYQGRLTLARDLRDLEASLSLLRKILVAGGLTVLVIGALMSWALAAGLLRPLGRMRAAAQRIGDERDFASRLPDDDRRDEISRLSKSFNQMLAELEQSHDDLKTTLDAQRRFVADASHELRTPMTAIRTNLEFLARVPGAREEDRSAALHDVLAEMRRMEALVGDLLALARLEAAAVGPVRRAVRLDHLLADIHRDASRLAPSGVEVRLEPARLPHVWVSGDRDDLRRAVWNLVDNALKYTIAGHVELRLTVGDGMAELEVRDSGMGIAEADQRHVFDRFWRSQRTRGMTGSGLGLAITKWVAQAHGGSVQVDSVLGEGSVFALRLPAATVRRSARRPRTPAVRQPASPAHS
jgi:two-component system, OmpR family, sensor kinase